MFLSVFKVLPGSATSSYHDCRIFTRSSVFFFPVLYDAVSMVKGNINGSVHAWRRKAVESGRCEMRERVYYYYSSFAIKPSSFIFHPWWGFFCSLVRYAVEGTLCVDFRYSTEPCAYICVFLWRSDGCSSRKLLKKIFAENFHGKFSFP